MKFDNHDYNYLNYITEHKINVMKAFNKLYDFWEQVLKNRNELIYLREKILIHDNSKYNLEQFNSYCNKFFRKIDDGNFNSAWKDHYTKEIHHPESWKNYSSKGGMSRLSIVEMCLDWHAMSLKFGDSSLKYFYNKKSNLSKEFPFLIKDFEYIEKILINLNKE